MPDATAVTNPANPSPGIPGGGGQANPDVVKTTSTPAINLDSKIQVDGKEISVKELLDKAAALETERANVQKLQEYRQHTERLLKGDTQGPLKEESMRYLLAQSGYQPEEIEAYVQQALDAELEAPMANSDPTQPRNSVAPEPKGSEEVARLQAKLELMEQEQQKAKLNTLKRELGSNTDRVLDSDPELRTLVTKIKDLRGEEGLKEALQALKSDIQDRTVKQLKMRTATSGQLVNDAWIAEEVDKAAKLVYRHYLSVIGDPNRIGRAPETVTGEDIFSKRKPVEPPSYERGDNAGSVQTKLREFGVDLLSRLAATGEGGGASKA